jgi:virulence-associated protein VagC
MNKLILIIVFFLTLSRASAQYNETVNSVIDKQFGIIRELPSRGAEVKGSVYLNDDWIPSTVYLKPGNFSVDKFENIPVKVNLKTNELEIQTRDGIRILEALQIKAFEWANSVDKHREQFVNCNTLTTDSNGLSGFCKVSGADVKLIRQDYLDVLKSNYNVAMDVGSKDDQIIKKFKLYLLRDNKIKPCNKKTLYAVMADKAKEVKKFIKVNNLRITREEDARMVVDFYNKK